jgi:nickel-dependent lactate racemase
MARGSRRPPIVVDDLTRPTPAERVLPAVLGQLAVAGVAAADVSILMATTHEGGRDTTRSSRRLASWKRSHAD